jgi:putative transposase
MTEAARTAKPNQSFRFITDGNPAYASGILFLNQSNPNNLIEHHKVVGLQNLDQESTDFRAFKQLIERLNRTYKFHVKQANGFKSILGAIALTTLFVTHYNFLRPHSALRYSVPIPLKELSSIPTLQGKWAKLLNMSLALA